METKLLGNELLRGDHVYLNRITREDVPAMARMWSDVGYLRQLSRRQAYPSTLEEMEDWYKHMSDDDAPPYFAIRLLTDNTFIGACAFKDIRWQSRHTFFWIGIGDSANRGRGYGPDATRILLRYGFMEMNFNCIALEVMSYNQAAIAAYRKVGFQHDGLVRAYMYRDGQYYDMHLMSMLRSEWEARYATQAVPE